MHRKALQRCDVQRCQSNGVQCKPCESQQSGSQLAAFHMTKRKAEKEQARKQVPKKHIDLAFRLGPLRGKAVRMGFLCDVAAEANISVNDVRKLLDGIRVVLGRNLKEHKYTRIPDLVRLRVRALPARDAFTVSIKGKERTFAAKQRTFRVAGAALKWLREAM